MLVQDPSKGNHDVDSIFDQARQMGAMEGPLEHHSSSSSRSFTGTGRLLSGETVTPAPPQQPSNVVHNISFWTNGFTVNDGPLRRFDDPENASFLEVGYLLACCSCFCIFVLLAIIFVILSRQKKIK